MVRRRVPDKSSSNSVRIEHSNCKENAFSLKLSYNKKTVTCAILLNTKTLLLLWTQHLNFDSSLI